MIVVVETEDDCKYRFEPTSEGIMFLGSDTDLTVRGGMLHSVEFSKKRPVKFSYYALNKYGKIGRQLICLSTAVVRKISVEME